MSTSFNDETCHAVVRHGRVYLPALTARDLTSDIAGQTQDALDQLSIHLAALGVDATRLLTVHIWLRDMSLFREMTAVWNNWVDQERPPSRSCVSAGPATLGAHLTIVATASAPVSLQADQPIERYGMVHGPGRPTMCLGLGCGDWFTVCLIAPDCTVGIAGQTQQILTLFDSYLADAGTDKTQLLTAEIWLKNMTDLDAVRGIWREWLGNAGRPAVSCVRADMARPEMLIEIRISAAR